MRKLFIVLLILGLVMIMGLGVFVLYYYPHFVRPRKEYESAVALFEQSNYVSAAMKFETMSNYSNSAEYAKRAWLEAGNRSFETGEYTLAKEYYTKAGADKSVFESIDLAYFEAGKEAYAEGKNDEGESYFRCISDDSELRANLDSVRIEYAATLIAEDDAEPDDFEAAESVFAWCGRESYPAISEIWYACGENMVKHWALDNADICFAKAINYGSDAEALQERINAVWIAAGEEAEQAADDAYANDPNDELVQTYRELADKCYSRGNYTYDREGNLNKAAYDEAVALYGQKKYFEALAKFGEIEEYEDSAQYIDNITNVLSRWFVAGGYAFYAILDDEGRVEARGDWEVYSSPTDWPAVEKLAVGYYRFMIGVKSDGTVVGSGNDMWGNLRISDWTDIKQVACGDMHSVGLKNDGTVVACGRDYYGQVSHAMEWTDITSIDAGVGLTVGLKEDRTVVAAGENAHGECEVAFMHDIEQLECGAYHVVGLKSDGTVVACGLNDDGQCNVGGWTDIIAIYCGAYHTVGLKSDGTLVACGANSYGECEVSQYRDPICVSCGRGFTLMILKDGRIIKLGAINNVD